jgi:hypothetical protein
MSHPLLSPISNFSLQTVSNSVIYSSVSIWTPNIRHGWFVVLGRTVRDVGVGRLWTVCALDRTVRDDAGSSSSQQPRSCPLGERSYGNPGRRVTRGVPRRRRVGYELRDQIEEETSWINDQILPLGRRS